MQEPSGYPLACACPARRRVANTGSAESPQGPRRLSLDRTAIVHYDYVVVLLSIEAVASTCNLEIRLAQLEEHRPYKPEVTGSSPVPPIELFWGRSSVG
jgi:hypothetical protein